MFCSCFVLFAIAAACVERCVLLVCCSCVLLSLLVLSNVVVRVLWLALCRCLSLCNVGCSLLLFVVVCGCSTYVVAAGGCCSLCAVVCCCLM